MSPRHKTKLTQELAWVRRKLIAMNRPADVAKIEYELAHLMRDTALNSNSRVSAEEYQRLNAVVVGLGLSPLPSLTEANIYQVRPISLQSLTEDLKIFEGESAHSRTTLGYWRRILRLANRDGTNCTYCLRPLTKDKVTIDHVHPRSKGGRNAADNMVLACAPCNSGKGNKLPLDYLWTMKSTKRKIQEVAA